jgi:pimeloyl-ACP methyl ester carboxylesterase
MARHIPGPLHYEQFGTTGTPMVFLHSTPDDHRIWLYQTARFSAWYRAIAVDLAGYGRSPAPQAGVTIGDQAAACWELVDGITAGGVIIHGNSMGAQIAKHMASQQPERALAVIVSGTGYPPPREPMLRLIKRYQGEGLPVRHEQVLDHFSEAGKAQPLLRHYARMIVELDNLSTLGSIIAMNEALANPPGEEFYRNLSVPFLIICGTLDRSYAGAVEMQKVIKGAEFRAIEGAGHACMIENPAAYDAHCIEFLTKLGLFPGGNT